MIPDYKNSFYEFNVEGTIVDSQKLITPSLSLLGDSLSWNEIPGATSYELYLTNITSYDSRVDINLKELMSTQPIFNFRIKAISENSESKLSNTVKYIFTLPEKQTKIVIPTKESQTILPDDEKVLESVIVRPIPEEYIIPKGKIDIVDTNEIDVTIYDRVQIKDENLKPENIAENIEVLGIKGTFKGGVDTSDATATSDDILKGKTAYVNEEKVVGTIETYAYEMENGILIPDTPVPEGDIYEGNYTITPSVQEQEMFTKNKIMKENVKINSIPYYETSNNSDGLTVIIGGN